MMSGFPFADRIASMGTSIFTTISKMAFEHKAVNLGQGFPDFDGPEWIMDAAYAAMKAGKNQYAPTQGIYSLRREMAAVQKLFYGLEWDPEKEITVTAGATEALYSTIHAFIQPGDEVIVFEPTYDSYDADILLAGGIPRHVTLHKPNFAFNTDEFEKAVTPSAKMIILNSPHNPTGKVFSREELEYISEIAIKNDLLVICDEVYEYILFDGAVHVPVASMPGMRKRTITITSTGKTFGMTGWKIGFAMAHPLLTEAIRKVHQWTTFAVNTPGQHAMATAFSRINEYLPEFRASYSRKRDMVYDALEKTVFKPHKPSGSFFMLVDIPGNLFRDDVHAATELITKYGVATIPPSVFYKNSDEGRTMLRLCFAKKDETLINGIEKLVNVG